MPLWDLATKGNWELILSQQQIVAKKNQVSKDKYEYTPISPIYATPESHILLIGTHSQSALPHWFLGARASQYLYVSPSMNSNLISGVQTSDIKRIGLNRLTLVKFDNYDIVPYVLQLEIPYWLEDIYVEVWEYQGSYYGEDEQYENIIVRLESIEEKLDSKLGQ